MATKQKSLRDVANAIQAAQEALEEIERRSLYEQPPELSFEQRIIAACRGIEDGTPLKDYLEWHEIEQAIKVLADVYTVTGIAMPENWV